jgi:hypothetical protein
MDKMKKKGEVFVSVFLIILIVGSLGIGLFLMSEMESIQLQKQINYLQALNIAESGIERAIWKMVSTPGWMNGWTNQPLGNGYYTVSIEKLDLLNRYKIKSTGKVGYGFGSVSKSISLEIEIINKKWPQPFDYALFWENPTNSTSYLTFANNSLVIGGVFGYGNLKIDNAAEIRDGYVLATGEIIGGGRYQIGELPEELPEKLDFDTSSYDQLLNTASQKPRGDFILNNDQTYNLNGSIIYVNGNVNIWNNSKIYGPGKIVATGYISIENNGEITNNVDLISNGNITLSNNCKYYSESGVIYSKTGVEIRNNDELKDIVVIYTPGNLKIWNNGYLRGVVWGGIVDVRNNAYIKGTVYGENFANNKIWNNVVLEYDPEIFTSNPPIGIPIRDRFIVKKIHWSEDNP